MERRYISAKEMRVSRTVDGNPKITGYAAVFNRDSENLGGFIEQIDPGAFTEALKTSDCRALFNHDSNYVLGRESAETLTLSVDKTGLRMEVDPPDTQWAKDLVTSIERGDIDQQSFGFTVKTDTWEDIDTDVARRTITEIGRLIDVSAVTFPAYPDTTVAVRSLEKIKEKDAATSAPDTPTRTTDSKRRRLKLKTKGMKEQ